MSHFQLIQRLLKVVIIYEIVFFFVALWTKQYALSGVFLAVTLLTSVSIRAEKLIMALTKVFTTTPGQAILRWHTAITTKEEDNHGT